MTRFSRLVLIGCCAAAVALSQDPPPTPQEPSAPAGAAAAAAAARPGMTPPSQDPQPYDKVITKDAKTKKGLFLVAPDQGQVLLRNPQSGTQQGVPLELADRQDHVGRGLWRPAGERARGALGT